MVEDSVGETEGDAEKFEVKGCDTDAETIKSRLPSYICKIPLRDVVGWKYRGVSQVKGINIGVRMCMSVARFVGIVPLLLLV